MIFHTYFFSSFTLVVHLGVDVVWCSSDILFSGLFGSWETNVFFLDVYQILGVLLTGYYPYLDDDSRLGVIPPLVYFMSGVWILLSIFLGGSSYCRGLLFVVDNISGLYMAWVEYPWYSMFTYKKITFNNLK